MWENGFISSLYIHSVGLSIPICNKQEGVLFSVDCFCVAFRDFFVGFASCCFSGFSLLPCDFSCFSCFSCFLSSCDVLFPCFNAFAFYGLCCCCFLLVALQALSLCCFIIAFLAFNTFPTLLVCFLLCCSTGCYVLFHLKGQPKCITPSRL